ncbi:MAG TPA: DUF3267 domain-containing protein [Roseiflexaceae bacterium]|nr:DUF3267 domain-containing protein [Roseiflexaceae bacterium]
MPHSEPEAVPPVPPAGYGVPLRFRYPVAALQVASVLLLLVAAPLLALLAALLRGDMAAIPPVLGLVDVLVLLATIIATVLLHELVHGLAYRVLGYRVSYGVSLRLVAAYAAAFGQWQRRDHNLLVALAPLLVMTPLLLLLVALGGPTTARLAFAALLFNSAGAVGDLYLAYRLLRAPAATLLYDADPRTMWMAFPAP